MMDQSVDVSANAQSKSCIATLRELTLKKYVLYAPSCDRAIYLALQCAKDKGYSRVAIPDEGGWLTFKKYPAKLGLEIVEFKTAHGLISEQEIERALQAPALKAWDGKPETVHPDDAVTHGG